MHGMVLDVVTWEGVGGWGVHVMHGRVRIDRLIPLSTRDVGYLPTLIT